MASSSSSSTSVTPKPEYDVFLSFHGADTRGKITSHLYDAFCRAEIETFIDDNLVRGEKISPSLLQAIEQSKISVIIFSKGYASSRWCLKELEKILECKNTYHQIVIPFFYEVDPSDVRNQTGDFGKAFSEIEKRFMDDSEMLKRWKSALRDAANLSGFDSRNHGNEASLVKKIVDDILEKLGRLYNDGSETSHTKNLVGLDSSIEKIENLLCSNRIVGIWGMGGIGKTTLVSALFKKISNQFEASWFIENFGEEPKTSKGLNKILQKRCDEVLGDLHSNIESLFSRQRLNRKKVLIVFDDVMIDSKQFEFIRKTFECLYSESRIIITTRDKHVLTNCKVDVHGMHEMQKLCWHDALQLFSLHAFEENRPPADYIELSASVIECCAGLPLALEVLGASLLKRTKGEWESALKNLKISSVHGFDSSIYEVLKISYDGLSHKEKDIFLDIACFFKGYERDLLEAILSALYSDSHFYKINVLIDRSLITESFNTITMHDLLQEMGREIVRQESINDPGKRSRLWDHKDISSVLKNKEGTRAIQSIRLDMSKVTELHLNPKAFNKMQSLRFLEFYGSEHEKKVHGFGSLKFDFCELRYLCWDGYSAESLPPNFNPENLVVLRMRNSEVKELWTGNQKLDNLKHIDLGHSKHLRKMPDISLMPNLESLILEGCTDLVENFSSIYNLSKLVILNLQGCKGLVNLPISVRWKSLRKINFSGCSYLTTVPHLPDTIEKLCLDETAIKQLISIGHLSRLKVLSLKNCSRLESLLGSFKDLSKFKKLDVSNCKSLISLPELPREIRSIKAHNCISLESSSVSPSFLCSKLSQQVREFVFFNCSKLQFDMEKELFEGIINEIYCLRAAGKILDDISICYPGSYIPNWLSNHPHWLPFENTDYFIEFPVGSLRENAIGIICCVVVSVQDCQELTIGDIALILRAGKFEFFLGTLFQEKGVFQSDHVLLGFYPLGCPLVEDNLNSKVGFELWFGGENCWIKEGGVRLLWHR